MFAALSLVMIALAPNYIGDAEAREAPQIKVVLADPIPDVDLTITQVLEPQLSTESSVKASRPAQESSDSMTYRVVYKIMILILPKNVNLEKLNQALDSL